MSTDEIWKGYEISEQGWITRPGDDSYGGADVIEAMPTTERLVVRVGHYGPRGGFHYRAGGTLGELRYLRSVISEAITFGEEIEAKRKRWVAQGGGVE